MLTSEDLKYNFLFLKWISKLRIYPIHFDGLTLKTRLCASFQCKLRFKLSQICTMVHTFRIIFKTIQSIYTSGFEFTETTILIIASVAFFSASICLPFILFDRWPELFVKLLNEFHSLKLMSHVQQNKEEDNMRDEVEVEGNMEGKWNILYMLSWLGFRHYES